MEWARAAELAEAEPGTAAGPPGAAVAVAGGVDRIVADRHADERGRPAPRRRGDAARHQGFPLVDEDGLLVGVLTRRDLLDVPADSACRLGELVRRTPIVVFDDSTLRDAADQMVVEQVGRLRVVTRDEPRRVVGIVSRSDLLAAHAPRLKAMRHVRRVRTRLWASAARM